MDHDPAVQSALTSGLPQVLCNGQYQQETGHDVDRSKYGMALHAASLCSTIIQVLMQSLAVHDT